jgi:C1A family cysteine protease
MSKWIRGTLPVLAAMVLGASGLAMEPWNRQAHDSELARVREMIREKGYSWTARETSVSVLSAAERARRMTGLVIPDSYVMPEEDPALAILDFPDSFDWRQMGGVTPVRDQGSCGSCWAFAVTAGTESMVAIYDHWQPDLSEQQLVSCNTQGYGCDGGWLDAVVRFVNPGAISESCQPYTANDSTPCKESQCEVVAQLDSYGSVNQSVTAIKNALQNGPVPCAIYCHSDFSYYGGGCYQGGASGSVNHGVCIVGWDDSVCPSGAWIVKNSWGTGWGEAGFFYIAYGDSNIGYGAQSYHYTASSNVTLVVDSRDVVDDTGDGVVDPGEGAVIKVTLRNDGTVPATGVYADLSCTNLNVQIVDGQATWADIPAGARQQSNTPHFDVTVGSGIQPGTMLQFKLAMHSNEGSWNGTFYMEVGSLATIFYTGFEALNDEGWTHAQVLKEDDWQRGTPQGAGGYDPGSAYAGSNAWGNDLGAAGWDGNYKNSVSNYLESPAIDCTGRTNVHLQFMRWLTVEKAQYDQATIYVNGTQVWRNSQSTDLVDTSWKPVNLNISSIADNNPSVRVRFELVSDGGVVFGGWNLDEFKLVGSGGGGSPTPTPPPATPTPTPTPTAGPCTVDITKIQYLPAFSSLRVTATCSESPDAVLSVYANGTTYLGHMIWSAGKAAYTFKKTTSRPTYVQVRADCGGSDTASF